MDRALKRITLMHTAVALVIALGTLAALVAIRTTVERAGRVAEIEAIETSEWFLVIAAMLALGLVIASACIAMRALHAQREDRAATDLAHAAGVWVEAELGYVGGKEGGAPLSAHAPGVRTDPEEAADFVRATRVDALAVAVGSSHAMTTRTARLDSGLIARLHDRLSVPLVLHGSSGVPAEEMRAAIAAGIAKVNYGTGLNASMTAAVREVLANDPELVDPRKYLSPARAAMTRTVSELLAVLAP